LRDGSLLFVPGPGVIRRLFDGRVTEATRLASGDTSHGYPIAVAPSQSFVYVAVREDGRRIVRLHADGRETDLGITGAQAALVEGDRDALLFVRDQTLMMDERAPDTGRMAGRDLPVALHLGTTRSGRGLFTASADVLVHASAAERPRQLTWLTMDGERAGDVADVGDYWQVRLSPDETRVAVTSRDPLLRSLDVQVFPVNDASPALRLTASVAADTDPVWSPDGRQLLFRSMQRGQPEILITPSSIGGIRDPGPVARDSGSGIGAGDQNPARPLNTTGEVATDWRGTDMLIQRRGKSGFDLVRVASQGGGAVNGAGVAVAESPFNETDGRWSPDGRWVAYVSDEPGQPDVYVVNGATRQRISSAGGTRPRWTRDSRALLFLRGSAVMRADLNAAGTRFGSPRQLFDAPGIRDFDVAPRTDRILGLLPVQIEPVSSVPVILNWRSLMPVDQPPRGRIDRPKPVL
jgi:dipeptidyl aminopeptidase/acylaminoacyl peptidase